MLEGAREKERREHVIVEVLVRGGGGGGSEVCHSLSHTKVRLTS